jgi:hypothetical protein
MGRYYDRELKGVSWDSVEWINLAQDRTKWLPVDKILMNLWVVRNVSKETGLEVNADKTKCVVMSRDQNAGRSYSIKTNNSSFERVEEFIYLGAKLTHQNSIREEIKSRLKLGNACYYSVQNILSSSLLYKNLKIKILI